MIPISTVSATSVSRSLFKSLDNVLWVSLWDKNIVNKNYWEWLLLQENKMQLTFKIMNPYLLKNIAKDILAREARSNSVR